MCLAFRYICPMDRQTLISTIFQKKSFLCVGLDTDPAKLPEPLRNQSDAVFEFNKQIIDATREYCVAYKPNLAFYEARGAEGWREATSRWRRSCAPCAVASIWWPRRDSFSWPTVEHGVRTTS